MMKWVLGQRVGRAGEGRSERHRWAWIGDDVEGCRA